MKDKTNRTELHCAIVDNLTDRARGLISSGKCDLDTQDEQGYTPLHVAAQYKNVEIVRLLVGYGAKPDLTDRWGNTPLWRALGPHEENTQIIKLLLSEGVDPTKKNKSGVSVVSHVKKIKTHPNRKMLERYL